MQLKLILVPVAICLLGACALEPKRIEPPLTRVIVQPAMPSESDQLLVYFAQVRKFDTRELASEREQMRNAFQLVKSEFNRVKLAILLASTPIALMTSAASAMMMPNLLACSIRWSMAQVHRLRAPPLSPTEWRLVRWHHWYTAWHRIARSCVTSGVRRRRA